MQYTFDRVRIIQHYSFHTQNTIVLPCSDCYIYTWAYVYYYIWAYVYSSFYSLQLHIVLSQNWLLSKLLLWNYLKKKTTIVEWKLWSQTVDSQSPLSHLIILYQRMNERTSNEVATKLDLNKQFFIAISSSFQLIRLSCQLLYLLDYLVCLFFVFGRSDWIKLTLHAHIKAIFVKADELKKKPTFLCSNENPANPSFKSIGCIFH